MALSLGYVAPAAQPRQQLGHPLGGALADAVSCNAVVKAFGAEAREDARLRAGRRQMAAAARGRTWMRGTINGTAQGAMLLVLRAAIIGIALLLW